MEIVQPGGSGNGSTLTITDGITTVNSVSTVDFLSGATVTNAGGGTANVAVTAGTGDVTGPASSTDNAITRFDGATGKVIQNSIPTISDGGGISTTIANTGNAVGLAITQNDTTNNPNAVAVTNSTTSHAIAVTQTGNTSASISVGGAVNVTNTSNSGPGLVVFTNHGASQAGRLAVFNQANTAFDQDVVLIQNVASNTTALNVKNAATGKGGIKIEQTSTGSDANASCLSIDVGFGGGGTAAQGIFIDATNGGTTGNLLNVKNAGTTMFVVNSAGHVTAEGVTSTGATGTGKFVFDTSPTLVAPVLGTPASGVATNLTGTASGLTAGTVTTNANLTGPITSLGNATAVAAQTGTGNTFVMQASPTITTAVLGSSTATTQSPADNSTKLATTAYVDNAVLGQRQKEAVKYASTAALPSIVYANGSSGVGATLTGVALAAISLDSSSPSVADRVLIKNQVSDFQNGIYVVTATGSGAAVFVLTRATDFDQAADIQTGDSVFVTAGSTLANTTWTYNGIDSPTMGTTSLTFVQAAGPGSYTAGNGISITGVSIAIDTAVTVDKTTVQTGISNKTFTAPVLGAATATSINKMAITAPATSSTLAVADGKTFTVSNSLTLAGTDSTTMTFPSTSATIARTDAANTFTGTQTITTISGLTTVTGAASNMTITAGTGNSRTLILQTTTSGGAATTALTLNADQTATFASGFTAAGASTIGTGNAFTTGTIELGNASDTTLSRSAGGVLAVEGVVIPSISSTNTLTNKRITRRFTTTTQSATPTINSDNTDVASITALAQAITSMTTNLSGTPVAGDLLEIQITDNGTARALTFGASFAATTIALPTTTVISTLLRVLFMWDTVSSKWQCVATC